MFPISPHLGCLFNKESLVNHQQLPDNQPQLKPLLDIYICSVKLIFSVLRKDSYEFLIQANRFNFPISLPSNQSGLLVIIRIVASPF